jgi:leucyl-tRNA synthetase
MWSSAFQCPTGTERKQHDTGIRVRHPLSGDTLPVYIADLIVMDHPSDAMMGIPAQDVESNAFAQRFHLPIKSIFDSEKQSRSRPRRDIDITSIFFDLISCSGLNDLNGPLSGLSLQEAREKIVKIVSESASGQMAIVYKIRDWLISRQRYWGVPIPIIYCDTCGSVPVPDQDLPVRLPDNVILSGKGDSPLSNAHEWLHTSCPK